MEHPPTPKAAGALPPTPLTLDGSFILHQMFRVRWTSWRALGSSGKKHVLAGAGAALAAMEADKSASTGLFSLLGHKGDLMIVHFRKSLDELNEAELRVSRSSLNEFLEPTSSYLSVVELGLYEASVKLYGELAAKGLRPATADWNREVDAEIAKQKASA